MQVTSFDEDLFDQRQKLISLRSWSFKCCVTADVWLPLLLILILLQIAMIVANCAAALHSGSGFGWSLFSIPMRWNVHPLTSGYRSSHIWCICMCMIWCKSELHKCIFFFYFVDWWGLFHLTRWEARTQVLHDTPLINQRYVTHLQGLIKTSTKPDSSCVSLWGKANKSNCRFDQNWWENQTSVRWCDGADQHAQATRRTFFLAPILQRHRAD